MHERLKELQQTILAGELSPAELTDRVSAAIEAEYDKTEPDVTFIRASESLLREMYAPERAAAETAVPRYQAAIRDEAKQRGTKRYLPAALRAAAVVVAVVALLSGLRFTWFSGKSSPDEQQYILQGHEVSLETIQQAFADHAGQEMQVSVRSRDELADCLGFAPPLPRAEVFGAEYVRCDLTILSNTLDVVVMYGHGPKDGIATYTWTYYEDVEEMYFTIEQSHTGETVDVDGTAVYCTDNVARRTYLWVDEQTVYCLSGFIDDELAFGVIREIME